MSITHPLPRALTRLAHDRRGVAALEFGVIATVMITLLLGAYDYGNAAQTQVRLQQAVRAGGAYAAIFPTDPTGISTAVTNALPTSFVLSSAPSIVCQCLASATGTTSATVCTAPNCTTDAKIISITATMPFTTISAMFSGVLPSNTATYVIRYQ